MSSEHEDRRRVLITGVGGAPGFDLARSVKRLGYEVIAADADPLASGLLLPDVRPCLVPAASKPEYSAVLRELCRELRPDAVLSTVEPELPLLVEMREQLDQLGVRTWLPPMTAVHACNDKAVFATTLADHDLPTPRTVLPEAITEMPDGRPLVVKPRFGHGAKDVYFCSTRRQARILAELVPDAIIQEHVSGREFTADCLVDSAGRASVILRYRLLVKGGLSMVGQTFHDADIAACVRAALAAVGVVGVCCAQGFIREGLSPRVMMTEVNARFAGGFPLAEAANAELVAQALNGVFGQPIDHSKLHYTAGICLTKYAETLAVGHDIIPALAWHLPASSCRDEPVRVTP